MQCIINGTYLKKKWPKNNEKQNLIETELKIKLSLAAQRILLLKKMIEKGRRRVKSIVYLLKLELAIMLKAFKEMWKDAGHSMVICSDVYLLLVLDDDFFWGLHVFYYFK